MIPESQNAASRGSDDLIVLSGNPEDDDPMTSTMSRPGRMDPMHVAPTEANRLGRDGQTQFRPRLASTDRSQSGPAGPSEA
jgi:hypothetical protein